MNVTHRTDKDILYISLTGRIDASNASLVQEEVWNIRSENQGKHTVIDADKLDYISSAGLRMILKLRKEEPGLAIINTSPGVYEILDMTGFTDMVTIEKAYPQMSIEGCEFLAKGANGAVYRYDEETIIKTYYAKDALPEIKQERENARLAFVLGINTAIPYGIVRVGDGYGTVTELLNAESVTKIIRKNPDNLTEAVDYFVDMLKSIHAIVVDDNVVPDMKETAIRWAEFVSEHLPEESGKKLVALINSLPKKNTLLHGDYHSSNIMVQNGEPLLIDMDTLCMGHPVFELASMFNAYVGFGEFAPEEITNFFDISIETANRFWDLSLKKYLDTDDEAKCKSVAVKAEVIGYLRLLRRALRRPDDSNSSAKVRIYTEKLVNALNRVDTLDF